MAVKADLRVPFWAQFPPAPYWESIMFGDN
jgi:hypothetical protein